MQLEKIIIVYYLSVGNIEKHYNLAQNKFKTLFKDFLKLESKIHKQLNVKIIYKNC